MNRRDPDRTAWFFPAIIWAVGFVVMTGVGFGRKTLCTTDRPVRECTGIDQWAWFGVIVAGLVALLPVSRSLRERVTPVWLAAIVGVVIVATVIGMYAI